MDAASVVAVKDGRSPDATAVLYAGSIAGHIDAHDAQRDLAVSSVRSTRYGISVCHGGMLSAT